MNVKTDFLGLLDSDTANHKLAPNAYVNLQNFRIGTTDKGRGMQLESIGSNSLIANTLLPSGTNICIGACEDVSMKRLIFFNWNSNGSHGIYCYDNTQFWLVLSDSQVTGGLNFSKYKLIHSARVVGQLLVWTDGLNEPRCLNIESGLITNSNTYPNPFNAPLFNLPMNYEGLTLIKRPPIYPVTIIKGTDGSYPNNFIANNAYQFYYRYVYKDGQISVMSAASHLAPYNSKLDTYNKIDITIPLIEHIDDTVQIVQLCKKLGNFGKTFVIKTWDKSVAAELALIQHHNGQAPQAALAFTFYDDSVGDAVNDVDANTPFDSVPVTAQALEVADNRVFLGNNLLGYTSPSKTSLALSLSTFNTGGGSFAGTHWKYITLQYYFPAGSAPYYVYSSNPVYYAVNATISPNTVYYYVAHKSDTTPPATLNTTDADATFTDENQFAFYLQRNNFGNLPAGAVYTSPSTPGASGTSPYFTPYFTDSGSTFTLIQPSAGGGNYQFFKSNSTYKVSIAFYDRFRRKCGITKTFQQVTIPIRTYNQSVFNSLITWTLSNTDALNEIPVFAYYYQIHVSKNETTRNFIQVNSPKSSYVTKNSTTGVLTYNQTTWQINTNYATSFDLSQLTSIGLGYVFTDGDELIVYKSDGTSLTVPILQTDGNNVLIKPTNIGDLTSPTVSFLIEIFTPFKSALSDVFYETGSVYNIANPTTNTRAYSTLTDVINGDCYAIQRNSGSIASPNYYYAEAMSPNDKFPYIWQTDTGFPNAVDSIGQKSLPYNIVFSDVYIAGTKVNGLSKFEALNSEDLSQEGGALNKLILANKAAAEGVVCLAISEGATTSLYLGEGILTSSTGENTAISKSNGVIGKTNLLKGGHGTLNPESVVEKDGHVYFFDTRKGCFCLYTVNGITEISEGKISRFSKLFSDKYKSLTLVQIEALGDRPFIFGVADLFHREIRWTIPTVEATNPNGTLVDTGMSYPYDLYDGQGKTIVLKLEGDSEAFETSFTYKPEYSVNIGNKLFSFKGGSLYQEGVTTSFNTFYGVNNKARVMFCINPEPSKPKVLSSVSIESNLTPDYCHFRTELPNVQSTDITSADFIVKEGIYYTNIYRDRLSPNSTGSYDEIMLKGDKMRSIWFYQLIEFWNNSTQIQLRASNADFLNSVGHEGL